jgi:hypothetical protein
MVYYEWLKAHNAVVPFFLGEGGHVQGSVTDNAVYASLAVEADRYTVPLPDGRTIMLHKRRYEGPPEGLAYSEMWLNPGRGWRGVISPERAIAELVDVFDEDIRIFNKKHDYEACLGLTPFQSGNDTDWRYFNNDELNESLAIRLAAKYAF